MADSNVRRPEPIVLAAIVLGLGVAVAGWLVGRGFARGRAEDRSVTVKGVAEREARADMAFWPLRLVVADNDLALANTRLRTKVEAIVG